MTVQRLGVLVLVTIGIIGLPEAVAAGTMLPVSFHRQEHSLSCEVATLKMALGAHDIVIPESELIAKLPFDPTPKGGGVWGDPNKGFVGSIDGAMLVNGYGVYWDPIAAVGDGYADAEVIRHGSASDVARHVADGNPVIVWGYYGRRAVYNWRTPTGADIKAVNGEHTRTVYGFDGTVENPTRFYLIDPLDGHMSWSTAEFMHNWSALNHMGVVVKPPREWVRLPGDAKVWEINRQENTRRWVTTWNVFVSRGGAAESIRSINAAELMQYSASADIL